MNSFDEKLIDTLAELQQGNKTVFSDIVSAFSPLVSSLAAQYGKEDYDDSLQIALVALYNAAMSYNISQQSVSFGLYAKICISNSLISDIRKRNKKSRPVFSLDELSEKGLLSSYITDDFEDPTAQLIQSEQTEQLRKIANDCLSGYEKQVFDYYVKGMSTYEIAKALSREEKSVNNALCRITSKLKGLMK